MEKKSVYKIVLTGGPCSGKTTALAELREAFSKDFAVYTVPEVATTAITAGVALAPGNLTPEQSLELNGAVCQLQVDLEAFFERVAAASGRPALVFCDRGVCDNFAYITPENKQKLLEQKGWNANFVSHRRYDLVVHLVTAALGAAQFYTLANNQARSEGPEAAAELDRKVRQEWQSHPRFEVVDNGRAGGFDEKLERVKKLVLDLIGQPGASLASEHRKYLLNDFNKECLKSKPDSPHQLINPTAYRETRTFLASAKPDLVHWVGRRAEEPPTPYPVFWYTMRKMSKNQQERIQQRRIIGEKGYNDLLNQRDPELKEVHVLSQSFMVEKEGAVRVFTIETTEVGDRTLHVLRTTSSRENIPSFLNVGEDISDDPKYMTYELAKAE